MTDIPYEKPKKKRAPVTRWGTVARWTFGSFIGVNGGGLLLGVLFGAINLLFPNIPEVYQPYVASSLLAIMGWGVGVSQAFSLSPRLRRFSRGWEWRTALGWGTSGVAVAATIQAFQTFFPTLSPPLPLTLLIGSLLAFLVATPLLLMQSDYLRRMRAESAPEADPANIFAKWWPPHMLALASLAASGVVGTPLGILLVLMAFGFWAVGTGLAIYDLLEEPMVEVRKAKVDDALGRLVDDVDADIQAEEDHATAREADRQ